MPPKKSKARGRGRKASDASSISEAPSSQSQQATGKRSRRNLRSTAEEEHRILEEVEEAIEEEDELAYSEEDIKHVRFSNGAADDKMTGTHNTPHPRKMGTKRRATSSPAADANDDEPAAKRTCYTRRSSRPSLPASLSQDASEVVLVDEAKFAPLEEVLEECVRRRARIHELKEQLKELQGQKTKKKDVQEIESELAQLQEDHGSLDETMMVLMSQEYYAEPPKEDDNEARSTKSPLSQSQSRSYESMWAVERKQFQDAILSLSQESSEAKTKLQMIDIELQGLGFADEGTDSLTVLFNIREAFTRVREGLNSVLPQVANNASNAELIDAMITTVKDFAGRLKDQDQALEAKDNFADDLGRQIRGLIEHLADRNVRMDKLQEEWRELDQSNDEKGREIAELQEQLQDVANERDALEDKLNEKTKEADDLAEDNAEQTTSLERLTSSLKRYQEEESRLTELITRMEGEHESSVSKMNKEREQTVRELEDSLDQQTQLRGQAEQLSEERQSIITALELQIEEQHSTAEALRADISELTAQRDAADVQIEDLEARVDRLDEELVTLRSELEELRSLNEDERAQHDAAEVEVEDLNAKLLEQGKQANELRQKLFEVQQANDRKVKDLEQLASERDEQYQKDIAKEVERRETSEALAQNKAATILEKEARIQEIEATLGERDERLEDLSDEIAERDADIETLRDDLQAAEERHDTHLAQTAQEQEHLNATIAAVKATLAEREEEVAQLRDDAIVSADLHNGEIEDRNAKIAELNHDVAELKEEVSQLETDKLDLERRVESEAEQMLQLQNDKDDEIEALKETIQDKQAKILTVEEKAVNADRSWQAVLKARDAEIASLRESGEEMSQTVTSLTCERDAVRMRFKNYILKTTERMRQLQASLDGVKQDTDEAMGAGEDELHELEANEAAAFSTVTTTQRVQAKKTRGGRKKRAVDSGIGMENGEENESMLAI